MGWGFIDAKPLSEPTLSQSTNVYCISPGLNQLKLVLTHLPLGKMANDIFRCIFVNEKLSILIKISLKFARNGPIQNNPVLI